MEAVAPELPGAGLALERVSHLALILAGCTTYVTLVLTLAPQLAVVGLGSVAVLAASFIVWCLGFLPSLSQERAGLQCYALVALLAAPYVLTTTCFAPWIDMGLVAIAAVMGAVIAMPFGRALRVIAFVVVLDVAQVCLPRPTVAVFDMALPWLERWAGPLFLAVIGIGFSFWRRNWAASAVSTDEQVMSAQQALQNSRRQQAVLAAQHQSQRRLHETMLNTLFAVGRGVGRSSRQLVVDTCQADLAHLDTGSRYVSSTPVSAVVADATRVLAGQLSVTLVEGRDALLSPIAAGALRDAVVESLRNVLRHAGTAQARIESVVADAHATVRITDHGVGFSSVPDQHFGLTRAIQEPIDILGGDVAVTSEPGEGTEVELTIPVESWSPRPESLAPVLDVVVGPIGARLAAISPLYFGLATVLVVSGLYSNWWLFLVAYLAFALCVLAGAVLWDSAWRRHLTVITFVALALAFLVILAMDPKGQGDTALGTPTAVSFDWLVNCGFAATVITLLALPPRAYAWIPFALPFIAASVVIFASDDLEVGDRFASLAQALAFMGLAVYAVTTLFKAIEVQRDQALETWNRVAESQTRQQEELQWDRTISGVPQSVLSLVSGIANGTLDPADERVIAGARDEEMVLRWYLLEMRDRSSDQEAGTPLMPRPDPMN